MKKVAGRLVNIKVDPHPEKARPWALFAAAEPGSLKQATAADTAATSTVNNLPEEPTAVGLD